MGELGLPETDLLDASRRPTTHLASWEEPENWGHGFDSRCPARTGLEERTSGATTWWRSEWREGRPLHLRQSYHGSLRDRGEDAVARSHNSRSLGRRRRRRCGTEGESFVTD